MMVLTRLHDNDCNRRFVLFEYLLYGRHLRYAFICVTAEFTQQPFVIGSISLILEKSVT